MRGKPAGVQGVVLAELLSMWLAGHWVPGDAVETFKLREMLLADLLHAMWKLVPINAEYIGTT